MSSDILSLTPTEAYEFITAALQCKQVPYIAGPPAIGKSQIVAQIAKDAKAKMIDLRLSQMLSEDMTGIPERNEKTGKAYYLPFDVFPLEGDPIPEGFNGWFLFLDELSSATEEVLAAAYSVILDRTVGGKKLHPKCVVIAAGNRASDSAIARELPDTLITRMLPFEMQVSNKDWILWAKDAPNKNDAVIEFISKNPKLLYAPTKPKERAELQTYATPRGWEKCFAHVNMHERETMTEEEGVDSAGMPTGEIVTNGKAITPMVFNLMASAVGFMAARTFREEYDENIQLPYPWEVAQSPSSMRIPSSGVSKARLTSNLAKFFLESDSGTQDNTLIYMNRIGGEFSELFLSEIAAELKDTPSDQRLLKKTAERLSIDPLLGKAPIPNNGGGSSGNSPF